MKPNEDVLTLDPVAMNVVNRVASGSSLIGDLNFDGGVLVQGRLGGQLLVQGCVIVWAGGVVLGDVVVEGDMYIFGQLGELGASVDHTRVECHGTLYMASTSISTGTLSAHNLILYQGADMRGPFTTTRVRKKADVPQRRVAGGAETTRFHPRNT